MALITTADYKVHRNISVSTYDTLIAAKITAAEAIAARETNRTLVGATLTEKYNGDGSPSLVLRTSPITSVTSVTMLYSDTDTEVIDPEDYTVDLLSGVIRLRGGDMARINRDDFGVPESRFTWMNGFAKGHQNVQVVYVSPSWASTAPADLKEALFCIVDYLLIDTVFPRTEATNEDHGPGKDFYRKKYKALLRPFKRHVIG